MQAEFAKYEPLFHVAEAARIAVLDPEGELTGERGYLVNFENGDQGIVDAFTFERFFRRSNNGGVGAPSVPASAGLVSRPAPLANGPRKGGRPKKAAPEFPFAPSAQIREQIGDGRSSPDGPKAKILAALARKPMSSSEVSEATGLGGSPLYSTLNSLKTKGVLVNEMDTTDGTRRYRLVAPGSASA